MKEYQFVSVVAGKVAERCNELSEKGWTVDKLYKEGNKFHVLFVRERIPVPSTKLIDPVEPVKKVPGRPRKVTVIEVPGPNVNPAEESNTSQE